MIVDKLHVGFRLSPWTRAAAWVLTATPWMGSGCAEVDPRGADDAPALDAVANAREDSSPSPDGLDSTGPGDALDDAGDAGGEVVGPASWSARGPFNIGHRSDTVTYEANDGSGPRSLRVVYWYPTLATSGDDVLYADLLPAGGVLGGAAPATELGPRPVVVFSHGNSSFAEQSYFFTEFLASHGFLVVAPDHTGNTFGSDLVVETLHRRPADLSAVLDHLEALGEGDPLARLVSDRIAVSGHSFGGYTTLTVGGAAWDVDLLVGFCVSGSLPVGGCAALKEYESIYRAGFGDARVDALIPMSPGALLLFGSTGVGQIAAPTLLMTGSLDDTTPNATDGDPAWRELEDGGDNVRVDFATAGHFTFSDACSLPIDLGLSDGCGAGFIPYEAAHDAINAYALAFLKQHLLGDTSGQALLAGELVIESDVTMTRGR